MHSHGRDVSPRDTWNKFVFLAPRPPRRIGFRSCPPFSFYGHGDVSCAAGSFPSPRRQNRYAARTPTETKTASEPAATQWRTVSNKPERPGANAFTILLDT